MASVYSAFANPTQLPQIDVSQLMQTPAVYRNPIGLHVSLITTEELSDVSANSAKNIMNVLLSKAVELGYAVFTVSGASLIEDDVQDGIQEGKYVYDLNPSGTAQNSIARTAEYLKDKSIRIKTIGWQNGYHMTMYFKPVQVDQQSILKQLMDNNKGQTVTFGKAHVEIRKRRSSMNKMSFNKVGIAEYRDHLARIPQEDLFDIFVADADETGLDEFGNKTSAAMLAADELLLRNNVVINPEHIEDEQAKVYAAHLQRIASSRGIIPQADSDLFQ